jgi:hypothetical protein
MRQKTTSIILAVSLCVNAAILLFIALALSRNTASLFFLDMGDDSYTTTAAIVSFPAASGSAALGPVRITLKKGDRAALQFSVFSQSRQANYLITALYDRSLLSVSESGFGIIMTALKPGETTMQAVSGDGITDIATIRILDE